MGGLWENVHDAGGLATGAGGLKNLFATTPRQDNAKCSFRHIS